MSDTTSWEWVDGYENTTYSDESIFTVDSQSKKIQTITDQTLVAGEDSSQLIMFEMDRYYDAVDLSEKNLQIIFQAENGYTDINPAVCVKRSEDRLRLGWVVPGEALTEPGTLAFSIEAVGANYVWKTRTYEKAIEDGLNGDIIISAPTEKAWYIEIQSQCASAVEAATATLKKVKDIISGIGNPTAADTAAEMIDHGTVYVYTGSEQGYTYGNWYYYDSDLGEFVPGGKYASTALVVDNMLSEKGKAADAAATGTAITDLRNDLDKIKPSGLTGKKAVFFGDSISYGEGNDGHSYVDIINEMGICASLVKEAHTSSTVGPYQHFDDGEGFDLLQMIPLQSAAVTEADVVFCAYGGNDADSVSLGLVALGSYRDTSSAETVCGYMRKAIEDIRALNPTARIIWLFPQIRDFVIHEIDTVVEDDYIVTVMKAMSDVCADCNVPFSGLYSGLNLEIVARGHLMDDTAKHPSEAGQRLIAENVLYGYPFSVNPYSPKKVVRLFENGTYDSTYAKLLLMLTHDVEVVIDYNGLLFSCAGYKEDTIVFKSSEIESESSLKEYVLTITHDSTKLYIVPTAMAEQPWGTGIYRVIFEDVETIVADTPNFVAINDFEENIEEGDSWRITWNGKSYTWNAVYNSITGYYIGNPGAAGLEDDGSGAPFIMYKTKPTQVAFATTDPAGEITLKIEKRIR